MQAPTQNKWNGAVHVVKYLKDNLNQGLFYLVDNDLKLTSFYYVDWAKCTLSRKSITGFCVMLGKVLISWKSEKQSTVIRSFIEAEYKSAGITVCELKWLSYLFKDLQLNIEYLIDL
ncbi:hypothetical protein LIER_01029 [Lithospermum erythrorhizon]|uniref:Uncharacterized protein n=1 Tax=Lithospermum erythrorhizon TaxID=34254 RepID=A0AAV3NJI1_LITER